MNTNTKKAYKNLYKMGAFEKSAIERRRTMKNLAEGNFTQGDIDTFSRNSSENYGKLEQLSRQNVEGMKIEVKYKGENRQYWIPQDKCWVSGKGIELNQAYRIFVEDDKTMKVREVESFSERESIVKGLYAEIRRILKK